MDCDGRAISGIFRNRAVERHEPNRGAARHEMEHIRKVRAVGETSDSPAYEFRFFDFNRGAFEKRLEHLGYSLPADAVGRTKYPLDFRQDGKSDETTLAEQRRSQFRLRRIVLNDQTHDDVSIETSHFFSSR